MPKDLQWFKFSPLNWMTGRIRKEPVKIQIAFIEIICQYWKNGCNMTIAQAELEIGGSLKLLMSRQIVKLDGDKIKIQFLDEQMVDIEDTSVKRSNAAKTKWKQVHSKSMQVHASALQVHNGAMQIDADKIRQDKTRESYYPTAKDAFEDISNNYNETEPQRSILANRGWKSVTKNDTDSLLYHFLASQVDFQAQDIPDIKSHFKRWLNKIPLAELRELTQKINERFQR